VFGRRSTPSASPTGATAADLKADGKGRATPTRKEAEAARKQRLSAPKGRKEEGAAKRAQVKAARERQRAALLTGNDAYLPARDKGPVKRFARDYVDIRRTIGEILLPLFFLVFATLILSRTAGYLPSIAWLVILGLMFADAVRIARGVKAAVREKFGESETKGIAMYAVMRGWQMRRLRLPKPQVKPGDAS
jgi:Protein of unknown function (DUF3043)